MPDGKRKRKKTTTKKSGQPAGRNELEVNQTYRSYRSRYHYHLPNYYLHQVYIWTLPRLLSDAPPCRNSEITYVPRLPELCGCSRRNATRFDAIRFPSGSKRAATRTRLALPSSNSRWLPFDELRRENPRLRTSTGTRGNRAFRLRTRTRSSPLDKGGRVRATSRFSLR